MRLLMKSCKSDHHIDRCANLRLGTLEYFRKHPDPEVGDDLEAALQTRLLIDRPTIYPRIALSRVLGHAGVGMEGVDFSGLTRPYEMQTRTIQFEYKNSTTGTIKECDAIFTTEGSDALIFCMTAVADLSAEPRLGYEENWKMKQALAEKFGKAIEDALNERYLENIFSFTHSANIYGRNMTCGTKFILEHGPVSYRARKIALKNPSVKDLVSLGKLLSRTDMVKSENYLDQDEYRFCYRLVNREFNTKMVMPLREDLEYFDIPADALRGYYLPSIN